MARSRACVRSNRVPFAPHRGHLRCNRARSAPALGLVGWGRARVARNRGPSRRAHGPFTSDELRARYGVDAGAVLRKLERST